MQDLRLVRDKFTHVSRGFAFVHFHSVSLLFILDIWYKFLILVFYEMDGASFFCMLLWQICIRLVEVICNLCKCMFIYLKWRKYWATKRTYWATLWQTNRRSQTWTRTNYARLLLKRTKLEGLSHKSLDIDARTHVSIFWHCYSKPMFMHLMEIDLFLQMAYFCKWRFCSLLYLKTGEYLLRMKLLMP